MIKVSLLGVRFDGAGSPIDGTQAVEFNLRYPGQQYDKETGLYYNHHRTYDPYLTIGYTQADPLGLAAGWNRFGYANGNPVLNTDPEGLHKGDKWYGFNDREFEWHHLYFLHCGQQSQLIWWYHD